MYKKLSLAALSLVLLAGCANDTAKEPEKDDTTTDKTAETLKGTSSYDGGANVNATIVKDGENLSDVMIEFVDQDGNAVTELDQLYGPDKDAQSSIDTEWLDQVDYLENYIKENGVDSITVDENGHPTNADLVDYVGIDVRPMLDAVKNAVGTETDD
ncbi:hypothetical protein [uncultured Dubosiella sp.]|uniref:hypothetical protein n=1 Tax=uncultured Dubosiella sp. TaxID=1937011 RepID=UPI000EBAE50C|nr:hypothetical protein [uncultured Dubosiella sp.]GJM57760.1 hypothetical protein EROP_14530 [Erysipelotrichaceae bacterium OPF54]HAM31416.1 hypothetical protein [Erysipelotrichaceae bacterium]